MEYSEYLKQSEKTVSLVFESSEEKEKKLKSTIEELLVTGKKLDNLKKSIFYGSNKDLSDIEPSKKDFSFKADTKKDKNLLHFLVGKVTESIELLEIVEDYYFNNKELDDVNLQEELGDDSWYTAGIIREQGYVLEDLLDKNIEKLQGKKGRYKQGKFTKDEAENRDLNSEREILEK